MTSLAMFTLEVRCKPVRIIHSACTQKAAAECLRAAALINPAGHGLGTAFLKANPSAYIAGTEKIFPRALWRVVGTNLFFSKKGKTRYAGPLNEFLSAHGEPVVLVDGSYHDLQSALSAFDRLHSKALAFSRRGWSVNDHLPLTELVETIERTWPANAPALSRIRSQMEALNAEHRTWGRTGLGVLLQQARAEAAK